MSTERIDLAWRDNSDNEAAFLVERREPGTQFAPVGAVGPGTTRYDDRGLTHSTAYTYRVQAANGPSRSLYSNEAPGRTHPVLDSVRATPPAVRGGRRVTLVVSLTGEAPEGGMAVSLQSSNPAVAPVPTTLALPAGKEVAAARVRTRRVRRVQRVRITAALGEVTASVEVRVRP